MFTCQADDGQVNIVTDGHEQQTYSIHELEEQDLSKVCNYTIVFLCYGVTFWL